MGLKRTLVHNLPLSGIFATCACATDGSATRSTKHASQSATAESHPAPGAPAQAPDAELSGTDLLSIPNARIYEGDLLAGAIEKRHIRQAAAAGYKTIVNLRTAAEGSIEEHAALARSLGMKYVHIPIAAPEDLNAKNAEALHRALAADGPALVHCDSANRVGALYGARAFHVQGKSVDEALNIAKEAGITSLEPALRQILQAEE